MVLDRFIPEAILSPPYVLNRSIVHVVIPSSMRSASSLRPPSSPVEKFEGGIRSSVRPRELVLHVVRP